MDREILTEDEIRLLRRENPDKLFRYLHEVQRDFLFGVQLESSPQAWGGQCRLNLNRNIQLHFVPRLNEAMTTPEELPQFCVFPSADQADSCLETTHQLEGDEQLKGVVFYVDPDDYDRLVGDAHRVADDFGDLDIVPDTYFHDSQLIAFLRRVVLDHPTVRAEREYDFRQGLVGGKGPPTLEGDLVLSAEELAGMASDKEEEEEEEDGEEDGRHLRTLKL